MHRWTQGTGNSLLRIICRNVVNKPVPQHHSWLPVDEIQTGALKSVLWLIWFPSTCATYLSFCKWHFFFFLTWGIITWRSFKSTTLNLSVSYVWLVLHGAISLSLLFLQTLSLWPGHLSSTGIPSTGATASPLWPIDGLVCPVGPGCPAAAFAWFLLIYWSLAHTWCQGKYLVIESGNHGVCISCIAVVLIMC